MKITIIIFLSVISYPLVYAQEVVRTAVHSGANTLTSVARQTVGQPIAPASHNSFLYGYQAPILLRVDIDVAINVAIYPNPVHEIIYIESAERDNSFTIHTLTGKLLLKGELSEMKETVLLHKFPKGVYVLGVYAADGSVKALARVIKE